MENEKVKQILDIFDEYSNIRWGEFEKRHPELASANSFNDIVQILKRKYLTQELKPDDTFNKVTKEIFKK